jgi:hypothetical protein
VDTKMLLGFVLGFLGATVFAHVRAWVRALQDAREAPAKLAAMKLAEMQGPCAYWHPDDNARVLQRK